MNESHEIFMQRCLQLAGSGAGKVAPNPMVGSVLVHNGRIIGEGFHRQYGGLHAEPNCINSVEAADRHLVADSTLYVSLEPCAHYGKTPPCADAIIQNNIKRVVVGCCDPFAAVNGKGIEILRSAGVEVIVGVLEDACKALNKFFFTYHLSKRPYIILKWAQSADGFMGKSMHDAAGRVFISNDISNRIVHQWRSRISAILVGTNTALKDDPSLTTRLWPGLNPLRVVIDKHLSVPPSARLLNKDAPTIVFNKKISRQDGNIFYHQFEHADNELQEVLQVLYNKKINSLLVEGGAKLLQSFIDANLWDEARVITASDVFLSGGVASPVLNNSNFVYKSVYGNDNIVFFYNKINGR